MPTLRFINQFTIDDWNEWRSYDMMVFINPEADDQVLKVSEAFKKILETTDNPGQKDLDLAKEYWNLLYQVRRDNCARHGVYI